MIPYSTQNITEEDIDAVRGVLTSGWLTQGPAIPRFEQEFASAHQVKHGVAVTSATAALHIACLALGIGKDSRVWTSPISFVASANCALYCGAQVDFVDIDARTRNMSTSALEEKLKHARRLNALPSLLVPVSFGGLPVDLAEMRALADTYGFRILHDASHAVGARYQGWVLGGQYADISVFSFHPVKIITTGEGGMATTNDAMLAATMRSLRTHGITRDATQLTVSDVGAWYYEQQSLGFNYRLTDIQAALGTSQLRRLPKMHALRRALAERYSERLRGLPLRLPVWAEDRESSWHLYAVEIDGEKCKVSRAAAFAQLRARGIGVNVHYIPIHLQPFYRQLGFAAGQFPNSERYYDQALSLPLYPQLTTAQQDEVVDALTEILCA